MTDEELREALKKGDILSIGKSIDNESIVKSDFFEEITDQNQILKYNIPIGIDFTKSIHPSLFFANKELIEESILFLSLSNENRFSLDSLRSFLIQGKISSFNSLLEKKSSEIITPEYIKEAIEWIKE